MVCKFSSCMLLLHFAVSQIAVSPRTLQCPWSASSNLHLSLVSPHTPSPRPPRLPAYLSPLSITAIPLISLFFLFLSLLSALSFLHFLSLIPAIFPSFLPLSSSFPTCHSLSSLPPCRSPSFLPSSLPVILVPSSLAVLPPLPGYPFPSRPACVPFSLPLDFRVPAPYLFPPPLLSFSTLSPCLPSPLLCPLVFPLFLLPSPLPSLTPLSRLILR